MISGKAQETYKINKGCKSETFLRGCLLATPANLIDLAEQKSSLELSENSDLEGQNSSLELKTKSVWSSELISLLDPNERDF